MIVAEAEEIAAAFFAPLPLADVFGAVERSGSLDQLGSGGHRAALLGPDPAATLLAAFATHAPRLDCHSPAPLGPPPGPAPVADATAFRALIGAYHDRGYTVRIPDVRALHPNLLALTRALEILTHAPVEASAFWSRAGARAKVHYDNNDNISVQLSGRKRWLISTGPAGLQNPWASSSEAEPVLDNPRAVDVEPGDLIYNPRGLTHCVESTTDSIHVSILFTPLTRRAAVIAALDHLSDLARQFRATDAARVGGAEGLGEALVPGIVETLEALLAEARRPGFLDAALAKRSSRAIGDLTRLTPAPSAAPVTAATRVRHAPLAAMHVSYAGGALDLAIPGGHIRLHSAAEPSLAFIATTREFAVADIPGLPVEHCAALVERLIVAGLLETKI